MSDLPDHVDGLADPGAPDLVAWVRASFDAVRGELAALAASLDLQNEQVARLARAEQEAVALARSLPDRLGEAIAAAVDAQREASAPQSERIVETFRATLREIKAELAELTGRLGEQHGLTSTTADQVTSVAETVHAGYDRLRQQVDRIDQQIAGVPDQTADTLDDRFVPVRERLDRLGEDLTRLAARDLSGDLRTEIQEVPDAVEATVRDVVADAMATALGDLRAAIDAVTDSVTGTIRPEIARIGADASTTRSEMTEALADLAQRIDSAGGQAGRAASEAGATLAEEIRVDVTDALAEVRRTLNELVARDPVATAEVRELHDAVTARLDLVGAQLTETTGTDTLARVEASLDELRSAIGRIGQQVERPRDDPELSRRFDDVEQRIEAVGRVETVHRSIADLDARLLEAIDRSPEEITTRLDQVIAALEAAQAESAPLDELQASVQRLAAVIRELAAREETAVTSRIERLHDEVRGLGQRPDVSDQLEEVVERVAQLDGIADGLGTLTERVDALSGRPAPADPTPELDAISSRLEGLASVADVAAVGSEAAEVRAATQQSADAIAAMSQRIADLSDQVGGLPDDRNELIELAHRVDHLGQQLGAQLGELAEGIRSEDGGPAPASTEQIEARLDQLSTQMETAVQLLRRIRRRKPLQAKRKATAGQAATEETKADEGA